MKYQITELHASGLEFNSLIDAENKYQADEYAHKKALKYYWIIKTICVKDENGYMVSGYSRAIGKLTPIFGK
jgi:hypothetical protein